MRLTSHEIYRCMRRFRASTRPMLRRPASADFYNSPWVTRHPHLQILTIKEHLEGKKVNMPLAGDLRTFKKAPRRRATQKD